MILDRDDKYVANFGKQWRDHVDIQIDSKNGTTCSQDLLENVIFDDLSYFEGKSVLEIGCGAGRFSEHIAKHAKNCVLVDLSQDKDNHGLPSRAHSFASTFRTDYGQIVTLVQAT